MPIFEYRCQVCAQDFELLIRGSQTECVCPECGSTNLTKKFSTFGFKTAGSHEANSTSSSSCGHCSSHNCSGCHH